MPIGFIRSRIGLLRPLELIGGVSSAVLGLIILVRILMLDGKQSATGETTRLSTYALVILMLVFPGFVVLIGSYLQASRRKRWAVVLVLIGGVFGVIFVGGNAGFLFIYIGDKRGQLSVLADLAVILITMGIAITNLIMSVMFVEDVKKKPRRYG